MPKLQYLTNGESDIARRRRIFITGHHSDAQEIARITRDILNCTECTVFYYEGDEANLSDDRTETDLSTMNAVVLVVSTSFLWESCAARERILPFATAHTIPLLPILIESGLEATFNSTVGNLQCLNLHPSSYDATAIPYTDKLRQFLLQVLSADVDTERLRNAFDACVFLSYRKKDRRYAQQLMEMLHRDERCRNIAVWYDEFLVPGEDFNNSIRAELEQSALFLLTVTPGSVEADNYIILTEYPKAQALNKPILPFELLPTDREALAACYPQLPPVCDVTVGKAVSQSVLDALAELGIRPRQSDDDRDFLVGLAYLKGLYVEKNPALGVRMLLTAAENGHIDAMRTVAHLYRDGNGVAHDIRAAILWQSRVIDAYGSQFEAAPDARRATPLLDSLFETAQLYRQTDDTVNALQIFARVATVCDHEAICRERFALHVKATAYEASAELLIAAGDYAQAQRQYLEPTLSLRKELYQQSTDIVDCFDLIEVYESIAECREHAGDKSGIRIQVAEIRRILPESDRFTDDYDLLRRLVHCNNRLAHLYNILDKWQEAFLCIGNTVMLAEALATHSDSFDTRQLLIRAYINDGDQHMLTNAADHLRTAIPSYGSACETALAFLKTRNSLDIRKDMAYAVQKTAWCLHRLQEPTASEVAQTAVDAWQELYECYPTHPILQGYYRCLSEAAVILLADGNDAYAAELLRKSAEYNRQLLAEAPHPVYQAELAQTLATLADICKSQWEADDALACQQERCELLRAVFDASGRIDDLRLLIQALGDRIAAAKLAFEFEDAKAADAQRSSLLQRYSL